MASVVTSHGVINGSDKQTNKKRSHHIAEHAVQDRSICYSYRMLVGVILAAHPTMN